MNSVGKENDQRFAPDGNKNYDVAKVWDSHHEITRRLILGQKGTVIAREMGITSQTVSHVRNNPVMKRLFDILHSAADAETVEIRKRIVEIGPLAVEYLENAMQQDLDEGMKSAVGLGAAKTVIENILPKAVKIDSSESLTVKVINEIKEKAKSRNLLAVVEEGEFEELKEGESDEEVSEVGSVSGSVVNADSGDGRSSEC